MPNRRRKVDSKNARKPVAKATTKYRVVNKENPRYEGTRAYKSYNAMLKFAQRHGGTFTLEQLKAAKVDYTSIDAAWDAERDNIKRVS